MTEQRTPEDIRTSIEQTRTELVTSVGNFRAEIERLTDWRLQLAEHKNAAIAASVVAGFVIGGGLAMFGGRRRRRGR